MDTRCALRSPETMSASKACEHTFAPLSSFMAFRPRTWEKWACVSQIRFTSETERPICLIAARIG